jgi:hypothetical protein
LDEGFERRAAVCSVPLDGMFPRSGPRPVVYGGSFVAACAVHATLVYEGSRCRRLEPHCGAVDGFKPRSEKPRRTGLRQTCDGWPTWHECQAYDRFAENPAEPGSEANRSPAVTKPLTGGGETRGCGILNIEQGILNDEWKEFVLRISRRLHGRCAARVLHEAARCATRKGTPGNEIFVAHHIPMRSARVARMRCRGTGRDGEALR